jgi:hypothetical protein
MRKSRSDTFYAGTGERAGATDCHLWVREAGGVSTKVREWSVRVVAVVLSGALSVLAAEASMRMLLPDPHRFYVWPPNMRAELRPSPVAIPGIVGLSRVTVNSVGIRARELNPDLRREYRMLAIGGSTTECLFLDDSKTWPFLVQEFLHETRDGRRVWVGNIGKSGTNTRDHILQLKHLLSQYPRMDRLLMLVGINDLNWRLRKGDKNVFSEAAQLEHAFAVLPTSDPWAFAIVPGDAYWYKRTAVYGLLREVRAELEGHVHVPDWREDPAGHFYERRRAERANRVRTLDALPDLSFALSQYHEALDGIVDLARARGSTIALMTQPTMWRDGLDLAAEALLWNGWSEEANVYYSVRALAAGMALYNQELLQVCESRGIDCLDLASRVPRNSEIFYDDAHYTEKGAWFVARIIGEHLRSREPFLRAGTSEGSKFRVRE